MLKIEQQWFTDGKIEKTNIGSDLIIVHGLDQVDRKDGKIESQNTLLSDLQQSEEELYASFRKNTKYEIRKADKEGIEYKSFVGKDIAKELIDDFSIVFSKMYEDKGMKRSVNRNLLEACVDGECFAITVAYLSGQPIVYHSYIYDTNNTRLYQSCSLFRESADEAKLIGYANRGLHWYDLKFFKEMGVANYDWGGIVSAESPNGIDQFKMSFGGIPHVYYNVMIPASFAGKLAVAAKNFVK